MHGGGIRPCSLLCRQSTGSRRLALLRSLVPAEQLAICIRICMHPPLTSHAHACVRAWHLYPHLHVLDAQRSMARSQQQAMSPRRMRQRSSAGMQEPAVLQAARLRQCPDGSRLHLRPVSAATLCEMHLRAVCHLAVLLVFPPPCGLWRAAAGSRHTLQHCQVMMAGCIGHDAAAAA